MLQARSQPVVRARVPTALTREPSKPRYVHPGRVRDDQLPILRAHGREDVYGARPKYIGSGQARGFLQESASWPGSCACSRGGLTILCRISSPTPPSSSIVNPSPSMTRRMSPYLSLCGWSVVERTETADCAGVMAAGASGVMVLGVEAASELQADTKSLLSNS